MFYRLYVLKSGISRQLKLNILSLTDEKKKIGTGIYGAKEIDLSIQECLIEIQAVSLKKANSDSPNSAL